MVRGVVATLWALIVLSGSDAAAQKTAEPCGDELPRIAALQVKAQRKAIPRFSGPNINVFDCFFYYEAKFRPGLRALVLDRRAGMFATLMLATIGEPDDIRLIIRHPPRSKRLWDRDRWADWVASSLLNASTEEDWDFLESCAEGKYPGAKVTAIRTLMLIASPKSKKLLEEVQTRNQSAAGQTSVALKYISSAPAPMIASSPEELTARVAQAISPLAWEPGEKPKYNQQGDKALVHFRFMRGRDLFFYTATFYKVGGDWALHGVIAGGQALIN